MKCLEMLVHIAFWKNYQTHKLFCIQISEWPLYPLARQFSYLFQYTWRLPQGKAFMLWFLTRSFITKQWHTKNIWLFDQASMVLRSCICIVDLCRRSVVSSLEIPLYLTSSINDKLTFKGELTIDHCIWHGCELYELCLNNNRTKTRISIEWNINCLQNCSLEIQNACSFFSYCAAHLRLSLLRLCENVLSD